jgi:hypothetical protein
VAKKAQNSACAVLGFFVSSVSGFKFYFCTDQQCCNMKESAQREGNTQDKKSRVEVVGRSGVVLPMCWRLIAGISTTKPGEDNEQD